jgi:quercetin dioxygenase-like cupin family protein
MVTANSAIAHEPRQGRHFTFLSGEEFIWKVMGSTTDGVVDIGEMVVQPGIAVPEHIHHRNDEAFYLLEGRFLLTVAGLEHNLEPGAFVFVPRGVRHTWVNSGSEPARIMLTFTPGGMDQFCVEMDPLLREHVDLETILPVCEKYGYELVGPVPERP